ncbi:MAG TPA: DUF4149 domain-containing protein [Rubrivivax sp.]|nr:DUF4149 domain-containing protein [Rubrivivax sp.]
MRSRALRLLPGLWAGVLLCIAALAAPAAFAVLPAADAGRVVGHVFIREAWLSLLLAALLLFGHRRLPPGGIGNAVLLWSTVACTLLGYFAVQALMPAARAGQGLLSFGQLHLVSTVFYALKTVLVLWLAWRAAGAQFNPRPFS